MKNWLEEIVANKRREVAPRIQAHPVASLQQRAESVTRGPDLIQALTASSIGLIAEVKHKSPSAGVIRTPFEPAVIARAYTEAGAQALSVLMDEVYFGGGEAHFRDVRSAVSAPMLYKEFVVDRWQVWHAVTLGASAVLLIVAALTPEALAALHQECRAAGIAALVEVHDGDELKIALDTGATFIGINNRNLKTFVTTLDTSFDLLRGLPPEVVCISESGIRTAADVVALRDAGARGVLVGESLLRQPDPGRAVTALMSEAWACS